MEPREYGAYDFLVYNLLASSCAPHLDGLSQEREIRLYPLEE